MIRQTNAKRVFLLLSVLGHFATANDPVVACSITGISGTPVETLNDPLFQVLKLATICPKNVMELRDLLKQEGAQFFSTMVANRGFHNPSAGSFSFFETVQISNPIHLGSAVDKDELFFGHFTASRDDTLTLDQNENLSGLMIESIAWDKDKEVYNFYELIGSAQGSRWFYRGDSTDIWSDISKLHRKRSASEPIFGSKLRCSGCHVSGGPIMKELSEPHDSWWRKERPLPFAGRVPDANMKDVMQSLLGPEDLRESTIKGQSRLVDGKGFEKKATLSPQIALRPLFCPEELNLQSSPWPLEIEIGKVNVPIEFFVDERLLAVTPPTSASKSDYEGALRRLRSKFPEINILDGDHAWLSPVKSTSDEIAISKLISNSTIDKKFVLDVLAVDMTRPVFSKQRCELLQLIPNQWSANWKSVFRENLSSSSLRAASELLENMNTDEGSIRDRAARYLNECSQRLQEQSGVLSLVKYLDQTRKEISASEISTNPLGQILEPGFRVIFPKFWSSAEVPWRTSLSETTCLPE